MRIDDFVRTQYNTVNISEETVLSTNFDKNEDLTLPFELCPNLASQLDRASSYSQGEMSRLFCYFGSWQYI